MPGSELRIEIHRSLMWIQPNVSLSKDVHSSFHASISWHRAVVNALHA